MKKRQAAIIVMMFLGLCLTSAAFFVCYFLAQDYFAVPVSVSAFLQEYRENSSIKQPDAVKQPEITPTVKPQGTLFLALCYVPGEEPAAIVSVLDGGGGKLHLYTIPTDARIEFSEEQYRQLAAKYPSVPQLCWLGVLEDYMGQNEVAQVLAWVFGENFRCNFVKYGVMAQEEVADWYDLEGGFVRFGDGAAEFFSLPANSRRVLERLRLRGLAEDISYYAETLALLTPLDVTEEMIAGRKINGGYLLDADRVRLQMAGK